MIGLCVCRVQSVKGAMRLERRGLADYKVRTMLETVGWLRTLSRGAWCC